MIGPNFPPLIHSIKYEYHLNGSQLWFMLERYLRAPPSINPEHNEVNETQPSIRNQSVFFWNIASLPFRQEGADGKIGL